MEIGEAEFEELVAEALDGVPPELAELMDNVVVLVEAGAAGRRARPAGPVRRDPADRAGQRLHLPRARPDLHLPRSAHPDVRDARAAGRGGPDHRGPRDRPPLRHRRRGPARPRLRLNRTLPLHFPRRRRTCSGDGGPPSSSGPGPRPFTAVARVRIPLGVRIRKRTRSWVSIPWLRKRREARTHPGPVAQLVSAPPCHGGGRGFESRRGRHEKASRPCVERPSVVRGRVAGVCVLPAVRVPSGHDQRRAPHQDHPQRVWDVLCRRLALPALGRRRLPDARGRRRLARGRLPAAPLGRRLARPAGRRHRGHRRASR